jgi:hypothetical protein
VDAGEEDRGQGRVSLNGFFLYFGSKSQLAHRYPAPLHETIIEPFAGSAAYSVRHHHKRVILVEKDPVVAALWRYLIAVSPRELLALPELEQGQRVEDLDCCQEARWLIGRWIDYGAKAPASKRTPWAAENVHGSWGRTVRARLAGQVEKIRHWRIIEGDYRDAPEMRATWFVDPPYQRGGRQYVVSSADLDFTQLGAWCRERQGQVIVCEETGADWLPFHHLLTMRSVGKNMTGEVIWTNDATPAQATA